MACTSQHGATKLSFINERREVSWFFIRITYLTKAEDWICQNDTLTSRKKKKCFMNSE